MEDLSRELGIDTSTFYYWRKKYEGIKQQQLECLKDLEEKKNGLKQMYADVSLDNKMLKDVLSKSSRAFRQKGSGQVSHKRVCSTDCTSLQYCGAYPVDVVLPGVKEIIGRSLIS